MLPSPNPSGNFVKVTQRIEVQVKFETEGLNLKPGMMVELKIKKSNG
jgi:membrane fusion protein (multidrug efflux system)